MPAFLTICNKLRRCDYFHHDRHLISGEHYPAEAIAESDVTALAIDKRQFQQLLDSSASFRQLVFGNFSSRLAVLSLVFVGPKTPWGWVGLVPVLTGLIGWCPLYTLLGINTCGVKKGA